MSQIKVFHNGALIGTLELRDGDEFYIGRAKENDFVLPNEKGISRKHLHVFQDNGEWAISSLSKFGNLTVEGQSAESFLLEDGIQFQVPPFSFLFELPKPEPEVVQETPKDKNRNSLVPGEPIGHQELELEDSSDVSGMEVTAAGNNDLTAFLKVSYSGGAREILRLEGNFWIAGRDSNCEIFLNDAFMSRNHFEITRTNDGFYIRDLNSRNTTHLNGEPLVPSKDAKLSSGDEITIQSISILFEVHNDNFEELSVPAPNALVPNSPTHSPHPTPASFAGGAMIPHQQPYGYHPGMNVPMPYAQPGVPAVELIGNQSDLKKQKKTKMIRFAIIALIPLLLLGILMGEDKPKKENGKVDLSSQAKKLTKEQLAFVKDSLLLAQKHYVEHRYNLCLEQVANIHNLVPSYQNSKELQSLCGNQAELENIKKEQNRIKEVQRKNEAIIADVVEQCRLRLNEFQSLEQLQECLNEAKVIDPLHEKITALEDIIKQRDLLKQQQLQQKAAYDRSVSSGISLYNIAKETAAQQKWKEAIQKYENYLNSNYPDPKNLKSTARRELASVKTNFNKMIEGSLKGCKGNFQTEAFKQSILDCSAVLKIVPKHPDALKIKADATRSLNKMMKIIYEDANMEESFGNTPLATKKWRKIVDEDVKGGFYYQKAQSKLKKFGGG
ncbi:MAG: FHA domain-containing protein [Bdellovibrionales bacterium]|nr:FHA domain-containing protein [Bdellovibrionales bacterium]